MDLNKGGKALFNAILVGIYDDMSMLYELLRETVLHRNRQKPSFKKERIFLRIFYVIKRSFLSLTSRKTSFSMILSKTLPQMFI